MRSRYITFSAVLLIVIGATFTTISLQRDTPPEIPNDTVATSSALIEHSESAIPEAKTTAHAATARGSTPEARETERATTTEQSPSSPISGPKATLVIEGQSFTIPVAANETVIDAMRALAAATSSFRFAGTEHPGLGTFIESINGKANGNGLYWFLYVNGTSSASGASATRIHEGDTLEWRYKPSI